ncbi:MAG: protein-L-isoaspartate(D-aspartate) O-methyltransferase [Chloroflexota bacterium]
MDLTEADFQRMREAMVDDQLRSRGIDNARVLAAMRRVPRHRFVSPNFRHQSYEDGPLPIGENQTISQPFIVALMSQMLDLQGYERVLEIGTGCGYQTAVLCELAAYVYSLERHPLLADRAGETLSALGYNNVDIHIGDGSQGLPDMEPFDAILVTAAAPSIPGPLATQLNRDGGRLVVPVGDSKSQQIFIVRRMGDRHTVERTIAVRFVPLVGRFGFRDRERGELRKRRRGRRDQHGDDTRSGDRDDSSVTV